MDSQIEKTYNYITNVLKKQNKPLKFSVMYGDGSIHGFNKTLFIATYNEILNLLGWTAENDL